jgi:iron complex outermembrane receptor protein
VRYTGETQLDALNTDTVSGHTLVDMNLLYDLGRMASSLDGFTASLTVTNLFDERYYSCYDANNCWFGEERTVKAGLRYSF